MRNRYKEYIHTWTHSNELAGRVALMIRSVRRACATRSSSLSIQVRPAVTIRGEEKNDRVGWDIYPMARSLRRLEKIINYRLDGISERFNYSRILERTSAAPDIGGKKPRDEIDVTILKRANGSELRSRLTQDWCHINNSVSWPRAHVVLFIVALQRPAWRIFNLYTYTYIYIRKSEYIYIDIYTER